VTVACRGSSASNWPCSRCRRPSRPLECRKRVLLTDRPASRCEDWDAAASLGLGSRSSGEGAPMIVRGPEIVVEDAAAVAAEFREGAAADSSASSRCRVRRLRRPRLPVRELPRIVSAPCCRCPPPMRGGSCRREKGADADRQASPPPRPGGCRWGAPHQTAELFGPCVDDRQRPSVVRR